MECRCEGMGGTLVIAKIVNLYRLYIVDCSICKFYTVIKLSTNYICIVVNADSIW